MSVVAKTGDTKDMVGSQVRGSGREYQKVAGLIVAFLVLFVLRLGPEITGLSRPGQDVLAVFLWFIVCMIASALPKAIVGLASPLLLVLVAGDKVKVAFAAFNGDIFFLAAGAFVIAAAMMGTPLGRRVTLMVVATMKSNRVTRVLFGLALAEVVTHPFLPVVNESALFLPMCKGVSAFMEGHEHLPETRRINVAVLYLIAGLLPLMIGPLMLTSAFPNLILAAYLKATQHISLSWGYWAWLNLPLWGLLPITYLYVVWYFDLRGLSIPGAEAGIETMKAELGPITRGEIWLLICLAIGMTLWIGGWIPPGMAAVLTASLLFVPLGGISFEEINKHMLWDILMLLGGAISLGAALYHSGAVAWLARGVVNPIVAGHLPILAVLFLVVFGLHIARAGIVSAVAAGAAFVPLAVGLAVALHVPVLPFSLIITNCMQYAFFLPISITTFLIAWSASGTTGWEAVKFGAPLTVIANVYVLLVQPVWLRLIGLPL